MNTEYISIMEFADLAGVSITDLFGAVMRGDLDGLYKEVDRNTFIAIEALERFQKPAEAPQEPPAENPIDEELEDGDEELEDEIAPQSLLVEQCKEQSAMIRHLLAELRKADEKIAERDKEIHRLSLELAEMAMKSQTITEQALQTVNQQQILTAMATKKTPWYKRLLSAGKVGKDNAGNI